MQHLLNLAHIDAPNRPLYLDRSDAEQRHRLRALEFRTTADHWISEAPVEIGALARPVAVVLVANYMAATRNPEPSPAILSALCERVADALMTAMVVQSDALLGDAVIYPTDGGGVEWCPVTDFTEIPQIAEQTRAEIEQEAAKMEPKTMLELREGGLSDGAGEAA